MGLLHLTEQSRIRAEQELRKVVENKLKNTLYELIAHQLFEILDKLEEHIEPDDDAFKLEKAQHYVIGESLVHAYPKGQKSRIERNFRFSYIQNTLDSHEVEEAEDFLILVITFKKIVNSLEEEDIKNHQEAISLLLVHAGKIFEQSHKLHHILQGYLTRSSAEILSEFHDQFIGLNEAFRAYRQ